ncbi:MAG: hypothetical protein KBD37_09480 [Burkholderiales bacterium]|nr:hypothetical protein [Burkholderiales bacterium]
MTSDKNRPNLAKANFFILLLNVEQSQIRPFENQIEAQNFYIDLEKRYIDYPSTNILMVRMDSIRQIKKSYPNYFADSKVFMEQLLSILEKSSTIKNNS